MTQEASAPGSSACTATTTAAQKKLPTVGDLLQALTSHDNHARNSAERTFHAFKEKHPEALVFGLLQGLDSRNLEPHVRGLAAVLLRRALLLEEPTLWDCLQPTVGAESGYGSVSGAAGVKGGQRELQAYLLRVLSDETDASVRRKVGDLVGDLGRAVLDEEGPEGWPEFLPYVLQSASSGWSNSSRDNDHMGETSDQQACGNFQRNGGGGLPSRRIVTGLRLMSVTAEHAGAAAAADAHAFQALVGTLQRCLCGGDGHGNGNGDGCCPDVRLEAVRALGSMVVNCARPSDQEAFASCLPHLLQAIQTILSREDRCTETGVWYSCETLELVIELAEACPAFFRPRVSQCVAGMVQVAGNASLETSVRLLALEFLVSIVEASPAMCRKIGDGTVAIQSGMRVGNSPTPIPVEKTPVDDSSTFAATVIPVCFSMMTELQQGDDPLWTTRENEEDSVGDNVSEASVGAEALERVALALGARAALPTCKRLLMEGMGSWAWQRQHAALSALGVLASVLNQAQGDQGAEVVSLMLPFLSSPLPRIQHASLKALERLAEEQIAEVHHDAVVHVVVACLHPTNAARCPRVIHQALRALAQLVEACPEEGFGSHAESLVERCVGLLRQGPPMVREASVSLVAAMAEAGQGDFNRFYDALMPILTQVLSTCNDAEQRLLRGKTLECVSLVGSAVGKERFGLDALKVMQLMVQAQAAGLEDDDPTRVYMLRAWVHICKCLGSDFVPYLPLVMPPLLAAVSANVEVEFPSLGGDTSEGSEVDDLGSDVDCMEGLDGEVVAVRTCALEEQATACQMILLLAEALQEHFLPYVESVAGQLAKLINTSPHDDIRTFCMAAMPELVRSCGKVAAVPGSELEGERVHQLLEFCLCRLLESLDKEEDPELLMTATQACNRCVHFACVRWEHHQTGMQDPEPPRPTDCRRVLNDGQSRALAGAVLGCLGKSLRRRALRRAEATASEDWDEEEEERSKAAGDEEMELHVNLAELLGCLFKTHGKDFLPAFEELLLPSLLEMARPDSLPEDRKVAVHVLDHALEFADPCASRLLPSTIPLLLEASSDDDPSVSLPALFGIGASAALYGVAFEPFALCALRILVAQIIRPDARSEGREVATDNAVSALGSLLEAHRDSLSGAVFSEGKPVGFGVNFAWRVWFEYMPLQSDEEEAEKVALQLCRLLTESTRETVVAVLGSVLERLPAALAALAEMAGSDLVSADTRQRIGRAVLRLQSGENDRSMTAFEGTVKEVFLVPCEAFACAGEGLGQEQKGWLGDAVASCNVLHQGG
ncbi:unnamed protein product [Ascophyllum nodosum]